MHRDHIQDIRALGLRYLQLGDQAQSTSLLDLRFHSLLCPDGHDQNLCPALGYLICSGIPMKTSPETQNQKGKQVCHRDLVEWTWLTK